MGVPKFFRFITRKYPNVIIKKKPERFINPNISTDEKIETEVSIEKYPDTVDNLYLDMNCLIHPVCRKVLKKYTMTSIDKNSLEKEMLSEICNYILYLVKFSKLKNFIRQLMDLLRS